MIVVLNFGGQFAHLIARRVRDFGTKAEILPGDARIESIRALAPAGLIFSGSPHSVLEDGPLPDIRIFDLGIPVLGICYGHQLIAHLLGGKVTKGTNREFGKETLLIKKSSSVFKGLTSREIVWFSHGDHVSQLPRGFVTTASTKHCGYAGFADKKRAIYGIQFHPEVTHTLHGKKILSNFVFDICKAKKDWDMSTIAARIVADLRKDIGTAHVLVGISGGVDSLVAATLLHKAVGNHLHAVLVDTGLLRKGEVESVSRALRARGFKNLKVIDASSRFMSGLKGVTDPEKKRKIIGRLFISVFEGTLKKELKRYPITFLAQGTIYPDRIESAAVGKHANKIKSHHNLTLPAKMKLEIIEPLKDLYKDEVRRIGEELDIPREMVWRHPFPGPGLGIRVVGAVTPERIAILREADAIFMDELQKSGEYGNIWQAFAVLLPVRSVGVMGDARTYDYMIALRAVDSIDGMSADWHKMPPELLERIASRIVNSVRGVNRVLYDVTQKPPATIEYE
ncbi:MAG: glutamine-hydrolyzing GMP synthase [bacterium]|nr:glutamine-hydrolyzing GMP synthase [bacterium]